MSVEIHIGDCRDVLRGMPDASVESCVSDPPYGLGFMGKAWDHAVPGVEVWREVLRVLKPGGHLLAFAGTRTQHRMACAIEDAGFEIRDMIAWVYGSGFPKSHNVKASVTGAHGVDWFDEDERARGEMAMCEAMADGLGTALKPALEPITLARKPLCGSVAETVLRHGAGALNIDGCRVGFQASELAVDDGERAHTVCHGGYARPGASMFCDGKPVNRGGPSVVEGRWPANLIHDGSADVLAAFPDTKGQAGAVCGTEPSRTGGPGTSCYGTFSGARPEALPRGDTGSAARFFYCAKASKADRDHGLEDMEERRFVQWQTGNGASGVASSMSAGRDTRRRNHHPTVKPTALMRHLCRLVTPRGGVVLDPFMGTGSTGRGAVLEGLRFVGIEIDADYADIARRRVDAAREERDRAVMEAELAARQMPLFGDLP
ncbi:DNA-methyltransferase [Salipiger abyssi]|uniref:DNA-methyltransferase n=1 Tax=Salipiger abyssi TaxID=1250539 RepID=UPI004057F0FF